MRRMSPQTTQRIATSLFWLAAASAVSVLLFIIVFVFIKGLPVIRPRFLLMSPDEGGVFSSIVSTVYLAVLAALIGSPLGVGTAIFLTEYTRESMLTRVVRFGADCLAGIPSIIYGLFGFIFFVLYLGMGFSVLAGSLIMALMILPTVIRTSEEAIRSVPHEYRDVSYGLGCTRWQMVTRVVLPSALPGIVTGIVLGIGRCVSETAAVMLTAGSTLSTPKSPLDSCRTLSVHFYVKATEEGISDELYGSAAVLIIAIVIINTVSYWLMHQAMKKFS